MLPFDDVIMVTGNGGYSATPDVLLWLIEGGWRIYAPPIKVIIGLGNGLSPLWSQAITRTNDDLF